MATYSRDRIEALLGVGLEKLRTPKERGNALEELICYLLSGLPGIALRRNSQDEFKSMEIDIVVANTGVRWMKVFPTTFLVECKNWDARVDSGAVEKFASKLRYGFVEAGILVAANGVTGDPHELTSAYIIAFEQHGGRQILVIALDEIRRVKTTDDFAQLLINAHLTVVGSGKF